jgi:hypothetical protein
MTTDRIFYGYMVVVGIVTGAILIIVPGVADGWFKPWFWVLGAVALFDVSAALYLRSPPGAALAMNARVIGFVIGSVLMAALPSIAGVQVQYF